MEAGERVLQFHCKIRSGCCQRADNVYLLEIEPGIFLNGNDVRRGAWLVNHCCVSFNCRMDVLQAVEEDEVWLTAVKRVECNEELMYDYRLTESLSFECQCGYCIVKQ